LNEAGARRRIPKRALLMLNAAEYVAFWKAYIEKGIGKF